MFLHEPEEPCQEDEMVRRALHNDRGPIAAEELERRLDEEIRKSMMSSSYICLLEDVLTLDASA